MNGLDMVASAGFDPYGDYAEGVATKNKLDEISRANQVRPLMGQALQGNKNALSNLAGIDPGSFIDVHNFQAKQEAETKAAAMDKAQKVASVLYGADTPAKWSSAISYLKQTGHDVSPEEENFANRDMVLGEFMTLKDQFDAQKAAKGEAPKFGVVGEDMYGNKKYGYPPPPPGAADMQDNANASGAVAIPEPLGAQGTGVQGKDFLSTLDPGYARTIQSYIDGRMVLSARLQSTPYGRKLINDIQTVDPTYEMGNAASRSKVQADIATGTLSKTNNALNTAIEHTLQLSDAVEPLKNYDKGGMLGSLGLVTIANALKNKFGVGGGEEAVTNFRSIAGRVSEEMVRAYRAAGGAEADVLREMQNIGDASSPSQLHGALAKAADLLNSKIEANQYQYDNVMGPMATHREMISPKAKAAIEVLKARAGESGDQSQGASTNTPQVGAIEDGHRFLGGNPADPASWEAVK